MSEVLHSCATHGARWILRGARWAIDAITRPWNAIRCRDTSIPIEILISDGHRRRTIERQVRGGLRQLQRLVGTPPLAKIGVVVQQVIVTDRQLAGCWQLGQQADGRQYALLRLALQVDGRQLSSDELLATLAEQWLALVTQLNGPSVLVPVDLEPRESSPATRARALRPDPLMPSTDGAHRYRA